MLCGQWSPHTPLGQSPPPQSIHARFDERWLVWEASPWAIWLQDQWKEDDFGLLVLEPSIWKICSFIGINCSFLWLEIKPFTPPSRKNAASIGFNHYLSCLRSKSVLKPGWWYTNPSEKYEFVSWDYDIPNIWKNTNNQKLFPHKLADFFDFVHHPIPLLVI